MNEKINETMKFVPPKENPNEIREIIFTVFDALEEKDYDPINQIIGYVLSGDPTYITSHKDARSLVSKIERDELLEEVLNFYMEKRKQI